jgi:predicted RNA-binding protein associated with RNAse of E/G family
MRHNGTVVDVERRRVRDRQGVWYPTDRLTLGESGLYYGHTWPPDALAAYSESWWLPQPGWAVHRIAFRPQAPVKPDWYVEIDPIVVNGPLWHQKDGYLDVSVFEGVRYEIEDADELAEGLAAGDITLAEATAVLCALDRLCRALHRLGCSGVALLAEFAPELPR